MMGRESHRRRAPICSRPSRAPHARGVRASASPLPTSLSWHTGVPSACGSRKLAPFLWSRFPTARVEAAHARFDLLRRHLHASRRADQDWNMATFTVRQGKRYRARIELGWLEALASNELIADKLRAAGFSEVTVE